MRLSSLTFRLQVYEDGAGMLNTLIEGAEVDEGAHVWDDRAKIQTQPGQARATDRNSQRERSEG